MVRFDVQDQEFEAHVRASFERLTLMKTIGASLLRVAPGHVEIELPFREDLTQHHGFLSAAVLTAIADVACGYAAMTLVPAGASVLTVEYKVNFLSPGRGQQMLARGRVVRAGRTVTACAGDVFALTEGKEKLVATMLATIMRAGGEADGSASAGGGESCRSRHWHGADRMSRTPRPWCVCGGRGLRQTLREMMGTRQ